MSFFNDLCRVSAKFNTEPERDITYLQGNKYQLSHPVQPADASVVEPSSNYQQSGRSFIKEQMASSLNLDKPTQMNKNEEFATQGKEEVLSEYIHLFDQQEEIFQKTMCIVPAYWNLANFVFINIILLYIPVCNAFKYVNLNLLFAIITLIDFVGKIKIQRTHHKPDRKWIKSLQTVHLVYMIDLFILYFIENLFFQWIGYGVIVMLSFYEMIQLRMSIKFVFNLFGEFYILFTHLLNLFLILHILTCMWHQIIELEIGTESDIFEEQSYNKSLFVIIQIMTHNSQVIPQNREEIFMLNLVGLISLFYFAYIIVIIQQLFRQEKLELELQKYFLQNKIPIALKQKILNQYMKQTNLKYHKNRLEQELPMKLIQEVNAITRFQILESFFKEIDSQTLDSFVTICEDVYSQPKQVIIKEREIEDQSLYFIVSGTYQVISKTGQTLGTLEAPDLFGQLQFFTQQPRTATVVSEDFGRLLRIQRKDAMPLLSWNDRQIFQLISDQILYENKQPLKCFCCESIAHIILHCPKITYQPNKIKLILSDIQLTQSRQKYHRANQNKAMKAWQFALQVQLEVKDFIRLYSECKNIDSSFSSLPFDDSQRERESYTYTDARERSSKQMLKLKSETQILAKDDSELYVSHLQLNSSLDLEGQDPQYSLKASEEDGSGQQVENVMQRDQQRNTTFGLGFDQKDHGYQPQVLFCEVPRKKDDHTHNDPFHMAAGHNKIRNASQMSLSSVQFSSDILNPFIGLNPQFGSSEAADSELSVQRCKTQTKGHIHKQQIHKAAKTSKTSKTTKTSKTGTKFTQMLSNFQPFSQFENMQYHYILDFERMQNYNIYHPQFNYEVILRDVQLTLHNTLKKL